MPPIVVVIVIVVKEEFGGLRKLLLTATSLKSLLMSNSAPLPYADARTWER